MCQVNQCDNKPWIKNLFCSFTKMITIALHRFILHQKIEAGRHQFVEEILLFYPPCWWDRKCVNFKERMKTIFLSALLLYQDVIWFQLNYNKKRWCLKSTLVLRFSSHFSRSTHFTYDFLFAKNAFRNLIKTGGHCITYTYLKCKDKRIRWNKKMIITRVMAFREILE